MQQSEWQKERTMLIRKQEQFCKDKGYPMFAPPNGLCWSCNRDCVTEKWEFSLITGCPKCSRSFVD